MDDPVVAGVRTAYERAPRSWSSGPARLYRALADALVARVPVDLDGRAALDLGAGTGVASDALRAAGARVVGVDLAEAMLRYERARRPPGIVADARRLPFPPRIFDVVAAAFSVNHVPGPDRALAEAGRAVRAGGWIVASTFASGRQHPARTAVEQVLADAGFVRPAWFGAFKEQLEPALGDADAFATTARRGGLVDVEVHEVDVDTGVDTPEDIADWRLGMAQYIDFLAGLDEAARATVRAAAVDAVAAHATPLVPVLFLVARVA